MSSGSQPLFSLPTRVYWEDTDAGGVVYHARYVAFMERARTEWMRGLGHGQETLRASHGLVFAVRAMRIDFRAPARLDQAIECGGRLLLDAQVRLAALDAAGFRPRGIPEALHQQLATHVTNNPGADA